MVAESTKPLQIFCCYAHKDKALLVDLEKHLEILRRSGQIIVWYDRDIARLIKGRSAHFLRKEFPALKRLPELRTRSTFYSTAGNVSSEIIQQSIERQSKQ